MQKLIKMCCVLNVWVISELNMKYVDKEYCFKKIQCQQLWLCIGGNWILFLLYGHFFIYLLTFRSQYIKEQIIVPYRLWLVFSLLLFIISWWYVHDKNIYSSFLNIVKKIKIYPNIYKLPHARKPVWFLSGNCYKFLM